MNIWLLAAAGVSASLIPCADMCLRGTPERRLVGLNGKPDRDACPGFVHDWFWA